MMMGSVCADQQHKFCSSQQLLLNRKSLREIDIPPRKLLSRRTSNAGSEISPAGDMYLDSPRSAAEEAFLQKYLPYNGGDDDDDADPYSSDHFRMYEFKVRRCTRSRSHDWTDCPFAHPGEKARRRDPRRYHYSGTVCAEFRRGACSRGDNCEFAHGVFECWLHPARYRTEACKDGKNCKRKVCFFAHTPRQLRLLPTDSPPMGSPVAAAAAAAERKYRKPTNCCLFCHSVTASPTSTLMGMSHFSPPMSPPHSPAAKSRSIPAGYSPISRYADRFDGFESCGGGGSGGSNQFNHGGGGLSYKDVLTELMNSMDSMNVNEEIPHAVGNSKRTLSWVDVNFNNNGDEQQQFVLSPSTPNPCGSRNFFRSGDSSSSSSSFLSKGFIDEKQNTIDNNNGSASACPDLGWVNDLLT